MYLTTLIGHGAQPDTNLARALVASAAAIGLMLFTLHKARSRGAPEEGGFATAESQQQAVPDPSTRFARLIVTVLLIGECLGLVVLGIGGLMGNVSVGEIWRFLEKAALAETLAVGVFYKTRD